MAIVDFAHREIITSLVYFGPPNSGTTSNVRYLYEHLEVEEKSPIHHFAARQEAHESKFFDYMPVAGGDIKGFTMRIRVYSLPGDIRNPTHRDEVLRDVDALVFVADSRSGREADNTRHLLELESNLQEQNIEMSSLPMVFQLNHTDSVNTADPKRLASELNPFGFPVVPATASDGTGVIETHHALLEPLIARIRQGLNGDKRAIRLNTVHHGSREKAEDVIRRHINAIRQSEAATQDRESVEEATRVRIRKRYAHLKPSAELNVSWVHPSLGQATPFVILESRVDEQSVHLDLLVRDDENAQAQRINLRLKGRKTAVPVSNVQSTPALIETPSTPYQAKGPDLPPVVYGIMGVLGGLMIGIFVAFLIYG